MSRLRAIRLEVLESRQLLSSVHHPLASTRHVAEATPVVLTGTLTVNNRAASTTMDEQGDTTTSTPVTGKLGSLGQVRGLWNESSDMFGDYVGPDTLQLHSASGTVIVAFNNDSPGARRHVSGGAMMTTHPQRLETGTGAFAHSAESGTIELTTNAAHNQIASFILTSQSK